MVARTARHLKHIFGRPKSRHRQRVVSAGFTEQDDLRRRSRPIAVTTGSAAEPFGRMALAQPQLGLRSRRAQPRRGIQVDQIGR